MFSKTASHAASDAATHALVNMKNLELRQYQSDELTVAISHLCRSDARLQEIIENTVVPHREMGKTSEDVFYDLLTCVIGQQIHYRRVTPSVQKFVELFADSYPYPEMVLRLTGEVFAKLKLSSQKYHTTIRLATWWLDNAMGESDWHSLDDDAIRTMLLSIKGIGSWTIDMILVYTLQRPDVFPVDDYGLKKAMTALYGLNPNEHLKRQMTAIAEAWRPHRSLACRYLWEWNAVPRSARR
jgi:DNA-3-methyladenine glycosylase II